MQVGREDEISFTNMGIVAETVLAQGVSAWWSVALRGWFLRHGGLVSEIVGLECPLYMCCCGGSTPCWETRWAFGLCY